MAIKAIQESTPIIRRDLTPSLSIITVPPRTKMQDAPDGAYRLCVGVRYVAQVRGCLLSEKKAPIV